MLLIKMGKMSMAMAASVESTMNNLASAATAHIASAASAVAKAASLPSSASSSVLSAGPSTDAYFNGITTLIGALIGGLVASGVAYWLQVRAANKKDRELALKEAHQLMFCLVHQANTLLLAWHDTYAENAKTPTRFVSTPAMSPFDANRNVLDLANMTIMLDQQAGRAMLYELNIVQESYRETLFILNERSRVHREQLQPKVDATGAGDRELSLAELKALLGVLLVMTMNGMTDNAYALMHGTMKKLMAAHEKAYQYISARFPGEVFAKVDFTETFGILDEPPMYYETFKNLQPPKAV